MTRFIANWRQMSARNRAIAVGAAAATALAIAALAQSASKPRMELLYAGLDAASAGEVLTALERMDVRAQVEGDAIYVPAARRDGVRMALAREGLPQQGQAGFELLDDLNGFATTSEMFDATYWRAKEGELARTIVASPGVKSARVHIAVPKSGAFARGGAAPSAVVTATMARGRLDPAQATAMRYLVALAVPRLAPEQVAVIDGLNGVVLKPGEAAAGAPLAGDAHDRERELERGLLNLLEARVGAGNARVRVTLELDAAEEKTTERILDPNSRVLMSRETTDGSESGTGASPVVTVASNLPEGDAAGAGAPPKSQRSESSETTRYEISETRRERQKAAGGVARVFVAVLLNHETTLDETGAPASAPRTAEEIEAVRKLVATAAGIDAARGDAVTVESMAFEAPPPAGAAAEKGGVVEFLSANVLWLLQLLVPAIVTIILALFVIRPILAKEPAPPAAPAAAALPPLPAALAPQAPRSAVDDMKQIAAERKDASRDVLKSWLDEKGEAA